MMTNIIRCCSNKKTGGGSSNIQFGFLILVVVQIVILVVVTKFILSTKTATTTNNDNTNNMHPSSTDDNLYTNNQQSFVHKAKAATTSTKSSLSLASSSNTSSIQTIPDWYPIETHDTDSIQQQDIFVSCAPLECGNHVAFTPPTLWKELYRFHFRIVYVVGNGVSGNKEAITIIQQMIRTIHYDIGIELPIAILSVPSPEMYPNTRKDMITLQLFANASSSSSSSNDVVEEAIYIHADVDTIFVPNRLRDILPKVVPDISASDVYIGRPISSCECSVNADKCMYANAKHYCSGSFFLTTRATLRRIITTNPEVFRPAPDWSNLTNFDPRKPPECTSSDLSIGYMFNHQLGLVCTPFRDPYLPDKEYPGITWPINPITKLSAIVTTAICQQLGSPGGIKEHRRTISRPFSFMTTKNHYTECIVYHPVKQRHDVQYVWNLLYHFKDDTTAIDVIAGQRYRQLRTVVGNDGSTNDCPMVIYIPVLPNQYDIRQAIRLTWGKNAIALGMIVRFVIGQMADDEELHRQQQQQHMIEDENRTHGDIIQSPHTEGYNRIGYKTLVAMQDAVTTTPRCMVFAKVDPDTYFRPYQAYKVYEILKAQPKYSHANSEFYIGHMLDGRISDIPNVVQDPNSPWYVDYTGDGNYYPPYASGDAYLMSISLVPKVLSCFAPKKLTGSEDIHVGICVDSVKHDNLNIVNAPEFDPNVPCTDATVVAVADNSHPVPVAAAATTTVANSLFQRHEANVQNEFCTVVIQQPQ